MIARETIPPTMGEQRILIKNFTWQNFDQLLDELEKTRSMRLAYDQGLLEMMIPLSVHENDNRLMERLIIILVEELDLEIKSLGTVTCKRDDLTKAIEPDSCYYIQHEAQVRNKNEIDLNNDLPPDLIVEVEYTSPVLSKLPLYASLGVSELWCYNHQQLYIYQLAEGEYVQCQDSPTFTPIHVAEIPRFLQESQQMGEIKMAKAFRQWVREQL